MTDKDKTIKKLADAVERLTRVVEELQGEDPTNDLAELKKLIDKKEPCPYPYPWYVPYYIPAEPYRERYWQPGITWGDTTAKTYTSPLFRVGDN